MDGASKFVKGDAIAGIIIIVINIVGGIAIGMIQRGMAIGDALSTYTLLTIGDGLVTADPGAADGRLHRHDRHPVQRRRDMGTDRLQPAERSPAPR